MKISEKRSLAELKPLLVGRVARVVFGVGCFVLVGFVGVDTLTPIGAGAVVLLGASFLIGGLVGNPGCEITALPNLFLSKEKRVYTT